MRWPPMWTGRWKRCCAAGSPNPLLTRVDVVQPALFAVMVSLAALWRACGVEPDMVIGHSQGEIAAAYVAGGLSLDDAAQVVAVRSRAIAALAGTGGMASIGLPAKQVTERLAVGRDGFRWPPTTARPPRWSPVTPKRWRELVADCEGAGVFARLIPVDYASHSAHVEPMSRNALLAELSSITPLPRAIPFYSTVTGAVEIPPPWMPTIGIAASAPAGAVQQTTATCSRRGHAALSKWVRTRCWRWRSTKPPKPTARTPARSACWDRCAATKATGDAS